MSNAYIHIEPHDISWDTMMSVPSSRSGWHETIALIKRRGVETELMVHRFAESAPDPPEYYVIENERAKEICNTENEINSNFDHVSFVKQCAADYLNKLNWEAHTGVPMEEMQMTQTESFETTFNSLTEYVGGNGYIKASDLREAMAAKGHSFYNANAIANCMERKGYKVIFESTGPIILHHRFKYLHENKEIPDGFYIITPKLGMHADDIWNSYMNGEQVRGEISGPYSYLAKAMEDKSAPRNEQSKTFRIKDNAIAWRGAGNRAYDVWDSAGDTMP